MTGVIETSRTAIDRGRGNGRRAMVRSGSAGLWGRALAGHATAVFLAAPLPAYADDWVKSADQYAAVVTGKALVETNEQSRWLTDADRRITAVNRGAKYEGRWSWDQDRVCYDGRDTARGETTICARVRLADGLLELHWAPGGVSTYRIETP